MSIRITESDNGSTVTLTLPEKFDFSIHTDFRQSYQDSTAKKFVIDMGSTSYMDSAALGMLLQLREHTGGNKSSIVIKNAGNNVKEILYIANFDQLVQMD